MNRYISTLRRLYFPQDNPKKFNQRDFLREIKGAYIYGVLEFTQTLLIELKNGKLTQDELRGEIQLALKKSYDDYRKEIGLLRLPDLNFDEFFRENS